MTCTMFGPGMGEKGKDITAEICDPFVFDYSVDWRNMTRGVYYFKFEIADDSEARSGSGMIKIWN